MQEYEQIHGYTNTSRGWCFDVNGLCCSNCVAKTDIWRDFSENKNETTSGFQKKEKNNQISTEQYLRDV